MKDLVQPTVQVQVMEVENHTARAATGELQGAEIGWLRDGRLWVETSHTMHLISHGIQSTSRFQRHSQCGRPMERISRMPRLARGRFGRRMEHGWLSGMRLSPWILQIGCSDRAKFRSPM